MAADGTVVITADIDDKKAQDRLNELNSKIKNLEKQQKDGAKAYNDALKERDKLASDLVKKQTALAELQGREAALNETQAPLIAEAEALREKISAAKNEVEQYKQAWISGTGSDVDWTKAQENLAELRNRYNEVLAQIEKQDPKLVKINSDLEAQVKLVADADVQWRNAKHNVRNIAMENENLARNLSEAQAEAGKLTERLAGAGRNAQRLGDAGEEAGNRTSEAMENATKRIEKLGNRIAGLVKRVFVFSLITAALRGMRTWLAKTVKSNDEAAAAIGRLKGALLTLAQPIIEFVIPVFIALINVLTRVITAVASFVSMLFGKTIEQSRDAAKALYEEQNAIEGVGGAAKEANKYLAPFDELNTMNDSSAAGGGGALGAGEEINPDFGYLDEIKDRLAELEIYLSGALIALGAILAFSGANVPLGIALMAAGAIGLVTSINQNWDALSDETKSAITKVALVVGGALLALGAILALSGINIPLGIGLMAAGALTLGTAAALNWDKTRGEVEDVLHKLLPLLSASLLALGAILAFSGANLPLGIGLMAAGAVGLAASAALNWENLKTLLRGKVGEITAIVSGALLMLGAILTFSGANLPLGIGLMIVGAAGLATVAALNWEKIVNAVRGKAGAITAIASGALLALGVILALSGAALPLGIALIAAGATGLVSVTALNWNAIQERLSTAWIKIKQWYNQQVAPKLTVSYWQTKFNSIGEALKDRIKSGINAAIALFNKFVNWVNQKMNISWSSVAIAGQEIIPAGSFQLLTLKNIPMLAQGAVIPPNREFMAVLGDQRRGTNIEAPESLIRQIMREESGGANAEVVSLMRQMLEYLAAGQVIEMDGREFGRATARSVKTAMRTGAIVL